MVDERTVRAVRALLRDVRLTPALLTGSMSSSSVHRVQVDGRDAVLKVTGVGGQRAARRELAFYLTLAGQVPVATPRLLCHVDNDELTALVLSAHTPGPPAADWDRRAWLDVSRQLGALHSFPPPASDLWRHPPWLQSALSRPPSDRARDYWSRTAAAEPAGGVLDGSAALADALAATPECFIHGDCHAGNLLRDRGRLVWADWQATGIGSPAIDLAFLWGRAHSDSAAPPREQMLLEYATHRGIDPASMERSLAAAELGTLLFGWPEYARYHSPGQQDRTTRRLIELVEELGKLQP
jgi:aminoglycoside phosphotransferase (APT) family kinase protein